MVWVCLRQCSGASGSPETPRGGHSERDPQSPEPLPRARQFSALGPVWVGPMEGLQLTAIVPGPRSRLWEGVAGTLALRCPSQGPCPCHYGDSLCLSPLSCQGRQGSRLSSVPPWDLGLSAGPVGGPRCRSSLGTAPCPREPGVPTRTHVSGLSPPPAGGSERSSPSACPPGAARGSDEVPSRPSVSTWWPCGRGRF